MSKNHPFPTLSNQAQWRLLIAALVMSDVLMIGLAFRLAYLFRFELSIPIFRLEISPSFAFYQGVIFILIPLWLLIFAVSGLYSRPNLLGGVQEYSLLFWATTLGLLLVIITGFLEPMFVIARGWLLLAWLFAFLLTGCGRFWLRRLVYGLRRRGYFLAPTIIVGANEEARLLAEQLSGWKRSGMRVLGFVPGQDDVGKPYLSDFPTLGTVDQLAELADHYGVEDLILATSALSRSETVAIFKTFTVSERVTLHLSSGLFQVITTGLEVDELAYVPLVGVNKVRLTGFDNFLKLALDYSLTLTGLFIIAPLLLLIALIVRLDSPGPVIFRRRVMGVNGRQFDAFKFRTMHVNGDEILARYPELQAELARTHKLKYDPRVTRAGRFLRKYSLDELPQLLNVLRYEMTLVGPRMISPAEISMYNKWDINLLTVRPGITGLWQVSGRSDVSYEERIRLDMQYIRHWNIWLDLQLLMQTIGVVLKGRGAY